MCFTNSFFSPECVKYVYTSVKEAAWHLVLCHCCASQMLNFSQHSYTQGRFRVYQHLNDLNNERLQAEDVEALRYNKKIFV